MVTKQTVAPSSVHSVLMSNAGLCDCGPRSRTSCDPIKCNYAGVKPLNAKAAKANKVMPAQELAAASISCVQVERNVRLSSAEFEDLIRDYQPKDHLLARKRKLRVTDDKLKKTSKSNPSESETGLLFILFIIYSSFLYVGFNSLQTDPIVIDSEPETEDDVSGDDEKYPVEITGPSVTVSADSISSTKFAITVTQTKFKVKKAGFVKKNQTPAEHIDYVCRQIVPVAEIPRNGLSELRNPLGVQCDLCHHSFTGKGLKNFNIILHLKTAKHKNSVDAHLATVCL